jgi:hypothetical protein
VFLFQPVQPLVLTRPRPLCQRQIVLSVASSRLPGLVAVPQPFEPVLAHRLQHAVAYLAAVLARFCQNQGLLDQVSEEHQHVRFVARLPVPAYRFGRLQREAPGENRQSREQALLGFGEELVAPVECAAHRPLALGEVPRPAGLQCPVQPREQGRGTQVPDPRRRQLQRQR